MPQNRISGQKFVNKKVKREFKGEQIILDSKLECRRFDELVIKESAGIIRDLRVHVPFPVFINDQLVCRYEADFVYVEDGEQVVEDAKGFRTPVYNLKKKLIKAALGINIIEWPERKDRRKAKWRYT